MGLSFHERNFTSCFKSQHKITSTMTISKVISAEKKAKGAKRSLYLHKDFFEIDITGLTITRNDG